MPTLLIAILAMQFVVSVKAGLVNDVQGTVNVAKTEMAGAARPIRTGADGYVEILLRPGSFLRLGENSEATIDDVDLQNVKVTVTRGPAVIEVVALSKDYPITVTTGNLTTEIIDGGIYRFSDGAATVFEGKLRTLGSKLAYEKGWQVFFQDNYRARKVGKIQATALDVYSQARSEIIARANLSLASSLNGSSSYGSYDLWLYSPSLGMYTFIPQWNYRSPYGFRYYGVGGGRLARQTDNSGTTNADSGPALPSNAGNNPGNSGGTTSSPSAPTANTPSGERSAPSTYIESKGSKVGAPVPD